MEHASHKMAIFIFIIDLHLIHNLFVGSICNLLQTWHNISILYHNIMDVFVLLLIQEQEKKDHEHTLEQLTLTIETPELLISNKQEEPTSIAIIDII